MRKHLPFLSDYDRLHSYYFLIAFEGLAVGTFLITAFGVITTTSQLKLSDTLSQILPINAEAIPFRAEVPINKAVGLSFLHSS